MSRSEYILMVGFCAVVVVRLTEIKLGCLAIYHFDNSCKVAKKKLQKKKKTRNTESIKKIFNICIMKKWVFYLQDHRQRS